MSSIATRLREFRAAVGLTQREVASLCGLGKRTIIYWEMGEREVKCSKLVPLVDEYDLDFNWLILGRGQMFNLTAPIELDDRVSADQDLVPETLYEAELYHEPVAVPDTPSPVEWTDEAAPAKPEQEDVLTLIQRLRRK